MSMIQDMTDQAKLSGRASLYTYAIGAIRESIGDLSTTADKKVFEIVGVLRDLDVVLRDERLPMTLGDVVRERRAFGVDLSKVPSLFG